jgi:signal transduction histidine kinase
MRARLLVVLLVFSALAVTAFAWPLLISTAAQRTQTLLMDRTSHLNRIAAIARHAEYRDLKMAVDTYHDDYHEGLLVVNAQGRPRYSAGLDPNDPEVKEAYRSALRNQPIPRPDDLRPWSTADVLLAEPIDTDTWANGAVVLRASVLRAAHDIGVAWLQVLGTALTAGVVCVLLAQLLARWVLRPLRELEGGVRAVAAGERGAHIGDRAGPRELRALAGSFNDMAAAVSTAAEQQSRLVADASHELRNPIARLRLTVESVVPYVAPTGHEAYGRIVAEVTELESLAKGLLSLAAADHTATELAAGTGGTDSCDATELLVERRETWLPTADRAQVRLSVPDSVQAVQLALPEIELKQVVDVAIDNAIKYAGSGAHIRLDCAADGMAGRVAITDDGPGLPETELAMATTRFWRSRRHHGGPGSGLGLAIAERLVTARGGTFRLRVNHPRGLVVELTLPLAKETP